MRPFVVELLEEAIKPRLLLEGIGGGRFRGFEFQREMHALVAAVLLGMSGFDAFELDAEPQPPHGQLAESAGVRAWLLGATLYLPEEWLTPRQRARAGIPETVLFEPK